MKAFYIGAKDMQAAETPFVACWVGAEARDPQFPISHALQACCSPRTTEEKEEWHVLPVSDATHKVFQILYWCLSSDLT
jgi:hypothetical protein